MANNVGEQIGASAKDALGAVSALAVKPQPATTSPQAIRRVDLGCSCADIPVLLSSVLGLWP